MTPKADASHDSATSEDASATDSTADDASTDDGSVDDGSSDDVFTYPDSGLMCPTCPPKTLCCTIVTAPYYGNCYDPKCLSCCQAILRAIMRIKIVFGYLLVALGVGCGAHGFGATDAGDETSTSDACAFCGLDAGEAGQYECSGDLRNVIDDAGTVITTCPPDEGCAGGVCVGACAAAGASKGSVGCDYVVPTPSFYINIAPPCFAIFVANTWVADVDITVSRGAQTYDVTHFGRIAQAGVDPTSWAAVPATGLPPNEVAVLFMSQDPSSSNRTPLTCPINPAISQQFGTDLPGAGFTTQLTGVGTAWHLTTDLPVTMYDILPYGGAASYLPSAELLFPTSAWGTNYFGVVPQRGYSSPQWGQLVAYEDGTSVTILPNVALPSGAGVVAAPANTPTTYSLSAGQYIQWQESNEMSGTVIQSNNPVGFFGGLGYNCYDDQTSTGGGCDSAHQQVLPVQALGSEYAVPPYATRMKSLAPESIRYRFVGVVNGTTLAYDPMITGTCGDCTAPSTLAEGQVFDFETTLPFVVKSQDNDHPFYVAQVMTGCYVAGGNWGASNCLGDEEYVEILPPAQFLDKYVFFTDPSYGTTNLVFTREKTATGFQDVSLDCMGGAPVTGWTSIDSAGKYEMTNVYLVKDGDKQVYGVGVCDNGPHTATSSGPFGVMVWGLDTFASYAYPAGGNIAPINAVVVNPVPH